MHVNDPDVVAYLESGYDHGLAPRRFGTRVLPLISMIEDDEPNPARHRPLTDGQRQEILAVPVGWQW